LEPRDSDTKFPKILFLNIFLQPRQRNATAAGAAAACIKHPVVDCTV